MQLNASFTASYHGHTPRRIASISIICALLLNVIGCGSAPPKELGLKEGQLAPCGERPNCVSSFATDDHQIQPLLAAAPELSWKKLKQAIRDMDDWEVVKEEKFYLRAVVTTPLMQFKDDVEFLLQPERKLIQVRSSSRVGYSDLGVNRERIEKLREVLAEQ